METSKRYGLTTAISMIFGIVIGSGIFFKSDDILIYTNGSVIKGVLIFCIAAFAIVFGSLTMSELAKKTDKAGGIISYAELYAGERTACAFGWFQVMIYYPTILSIIAWALGVYVCMLFGLQPLIEIQILIGAGFLAIAFILNVFSAKLGGYFQDGYAFLKILPLLFITILGIIYSAPNEIIIESTPVISGYGWFAAIGPIVFAFDGWIVSTSIAHEIKDTRKNLPLALIIVPIVILVLYIGYFVGISRLLGVETIMAAGDQHIHLFATYLLGDIGFKIMVILIILSILGTLNGLVLGYIRLPYALALRGMIPFSKRIGKINKNYQMPKNSAIFAFIVAMIWMAIHYITKKTGFFSITDISETPVVISYLLYIILYVRVIGLYKQKEIKSKMRGKVFPTLAILGSILILVAGSRSQHFLLMFGLCIFTLFASSYFLERKNIS